MDELLPVFQGTKKSTADARIPADSPHEQKRANDRKRYQDDDDKALTFGCGTDQAAQDGPVPYQTEDAPRDPGKPSRNASKPWFARIIVRDLVAGVARVDPIRQRASKNRERCSQEDIKPGSIAIAAGLDEIFARNKGDASPAQGPHHAGRDRGVSAK